MLIIYISQYRANMYDASLDSSFSTQLSKSQTCGDPLKSTEGSPVGGDRMQFFWGGWVRSVGQRGTVRNHHSQQKVTAMWTQWVLPFWSVVCCGCVGVVSVCFV